MLEIVFNLNNLNCFLSIFSGFFSDKWLHPQMEFLYTIIPDFHSVLRKHAHAIYSIIIYPEDCSIQIALVKTSTRFSYCTESRKVLSYCTGLRNVLSYCTGLRRGVPNRTTFARWSPWRKNLAAIFLCRWSWRNGELTERIDSLAKEINTKSPEDKYLSFWTT